MEMLHTLDTQICEAINNALALLAPKYKNFTRTQSYEYRKSHVIGMHNEGMHTWFTSIFAALGIKLNRTTEKILTNSDTIKGKRQMKQASFEQRKKRAHGFAASVKNEILKQRTEGTTYESNNYVNHIVNSGRRKVN